jgi:general secretion pathway protein N
MKKRYAALLCALVVASVSIVNAPAAWLAPLVKHYSQGTVSFSQSWGTVWRGSAVLALHRSEKEVLHVPQPLAWTLDINQLLHLKSQLDLSSAALQAPVALQFDANTLRIAAGQYQLPANSLSTLGAPFNTLKPSGNISLNWQAFTLNAASPAVPAVPFSLNVKDLRMGLTGNEILGDYQILATPTAGNRWTIALSTRNPAQAALLLQGSGQASINSAPQFELVSQATATPTPPRVQTLLNFLGRRQGDTHVLRIN